MNAKPPAHVVPAGQKVGALSAVPTDSAGQVVINALRLIGGTRTVLGTGDLSPNPGGDNGAVVIKFAG